MTRGDARSNVGAAVDRFVGRERELAELGRRLSDARLVTVTGPPGVGKSRLARELARRARSDAFPGGAWLVDLRHAGDEPSVMLAVAEAVQGSGGGRPGSLLERLASLEAFLLILDGFDRLVESAGDLVSELLRGVERARVVVTSRRRLGIAGEHLWTLSPLATGGTGASPSEAAQLLLDRTRQVRPELELDEAGMRATEHLAGRLDGIPLALELAADRLALMGPSELLARLDEGRAAPLLSAVESSWSGLDAHERSALSQCCAFQGGFDLAAAEAVVELDGVEAPPVASALQALRHRSMIATAERPDRGAGVRLTLLRPVRDFVIARAEPELLDGAIARHRAYYLAATGRWRRELDGEGREGPRAALLRERDNLLAIARRERTPPEDALRATLALEPVIYGVWPTGAIVGSLDAAMRGVTEPPELRAAALCARARARYAAGRPAAAEEDLREARALAASGPSDAVEGRIWAELGRLLHFTRRLREAEGCFEEALAIFERTGARDEAPALLGYLARIAFEDHRLEQSRERMDRALALLEGQTDPEHQARVRSVHGRLRLEEGRLDEARASLLDAREWCRRGGLVAHDASVAIGLARTELASGERERAIEILDGVLADEVVSGYRPIVAMAAAVRALADRGHEDPAALARELERGARLLRAAGVSEYALLYDARAAAARAGAGALQLAAERFAIIEQEAGGVAPAIRASIELERGHLDLALGKASEGEDRDAHFRRALARLEAGRAWPHRAVEQRRSRRDLAAAVEAHAAGASARAAAATRVWRDGSAVARPGEAPVDCSARRAMSQVLARLVAERVERPGEPLDPEALIEAGWPGERMRHQSGRNRLHVELARLRKLGLKGILRRRGGGYLLDPDEPLVVVDGQPPPAPDAAPG